MCPWFFRKWVTVVPCCSSSLLMMPILLFSMWVSVVPCCNSSLLMMPVLGSPVCEWLWCLTICSICWWCLLLAPQTVSGCGVLQHFESTDDACSWLFRRWVAFVSWCDSSLLMMPVLGSSGSEWLWCYICSLLIVCVLDSSGGEWLWCLTKILNPYLWLPS